MEPSPHYNVEMSGTNTDRLSYTKILAMVSLLRTVARVAGTLGWLSGVVEPFTRPEEIVYVKSSTSTRKIQINVHRNEAAKDSLKKGEATAVHLTWHSSGWMIPLLGSDRGFLHQTLSNPLLAEYPLTILDCDYAKSPEWPCPADTEDARDVYEWVLQNTTLFDNERITVGGFSAGATLALGLSVVVGAEARRGLLDSSEPTQAFVHPIKGVFAMYPVTTWEGSRHEVIIPPEAKSKPGVLLPPWYSAIRAQAHLFSPVFNTTLTLEEERKRKEELVSRPVVSPLLAPDVQDFSPVTVLVSAEYDYLTRDTEALRERLKTEGKEKGVKVFGALVKGVGHGWDNMVKKGQFGYEQRVKAHEMGVKMIALVGGLGGDIDEPTIE